MVSRLNGENWTSVRTSTAAAVLAIVVVLIILPMFLMGPWLPDSAIHNYAWIEGIAGEMRRGWIYPRWLSSSFDGLGSPSFYFYPPLPFLLMGGVRAFAGDWLTIDAIIQAHAGLLLFASGLSMWLWARGFMDRFSAMLAGIAYMIMPYHLFNHVVRGAIGEFSSYAILPLILLAMERITRGARFGIPLFAVLYAMLILTHLPTTLLVSVFVIPVYAVWLNGAGWDALPRYARLALAGCLGIGMSAAYLLPAMSLQEHINAQYWWSGHFDIRQWMLWNLWPDKTAFIVIYAVYAIVGLLLIVFWNHVPAGDPARRHSAFLMLWACGLFLAIIGIVPQIWTGVLSKVQFPWRLFVAIDLLMAVLVVWLAKYSESGSRRILLGIAGIALVFLLLCLKGVYAGPEDQASFRPREAQEYRAAGYSLNAPHPAGPEIMPRDAGSVTTRWEGEEMVITVSATRQARVTVPLNYFPAWIVTDDAGRDVPARAETPARLLSFEVAPGEGRFVARRIMLPEERMGWLLSLGAALLVLAGTALTALRKLRPA